MPHTDLMSVELIFKRGLTAKARQSDHRRSTLGGARHRKRILEKRSSGTHDHGGIRPLHGALAPPAPGRPRVELRAPDRGCVSARGGQAPKKSRMTRRVALVSRARAVACPRPADSLARTRNVSSRSTHLVVPSPPRRADIRALQNKEETDPEKEKRYRVMLSDGTHYVTAMLTSQLNNHVADNNIQKFTVIRLKDYFTNEINGRKCVPRLERALKILAPPPFSARESGHPPPCAADPPSPAFTLSNLHQDHHRARRGHPRHPHGHHR